MTTYARIVNGRTIDVVVPDPALVPWASNDAEWLAKLYPDTHESFVEVPAGTKDSAIDNEDGSYTSPPAPQPAPATPPDQVVGDLSSVPLTEFLDELLLPSEQSALRRAAVKGDTADTPTAVEVATSLLMYRFSVDDAIDLTSTKLQTSVAQVASLLAGSWRLAQIANGRAPTETDPS